MLPSRPLTTRDSARNPLGRAESTGHPLRPARFAGSRGAEQANNLSSRRRRINFHLTPMLRTCLLLLATALAATAAEPLTKRAFLMLGGTTQILDADGKVLSLIHI
jgi:hypothetical protein